MPSAPRPHRYDTGQEVFETYLEKSLLQTASLIANSAGRRRAQRPGGGPSSTSSISLSAAVGPGPSGWSMNSRLPGKLISMGKRGASDLGRVLPPPGLSMPRRAAGPDRLIERNFW